MRTRFLFQLARCSVFCLFSVVLVVSVGRVRGQTVTVHDDIFYYGSDVPGAQLDVYMPAGVELPYPTVVYVTPPAFTDENVMRNYAPRFVEQGYAAVGLRIRPQKILPDTFCGLAWVHANAGAYGFDTSRLVAFGYSGSGMPVATLGAIDRNVNNRFMADCPYPEPEGSWVQGVVTYEAFFMTPVALGQPLVRQDTARFRGLPREQVDELYDLLISTPPGEWRDIEDLSEGQRLIVESNPLYWMDGSEPPYLLIYGSATEIDWMQEEQQFFASQLEAAGVSVQLVEKQHLGHSVGALVSHTEEMNAFLTEIFGGAVSMQQALEPMTLDNVDQVRQVAAFEQNTVCTATFSPDRELLASGGFGTVVLWNLASGNVTSTLSVGNRSVRGIAFNPDGTLIAATANGNCGDTSVRVWNVASGELLFEKLDDFEHMATSVAFSPDGATVAAGTGCVFDLQGSASIKAWDTMSGTLLMDINVPSFVRDAVFSPDGSLLAAAGGDGIIRLYEVATSTLRTELRGQSGGISSLSFSPDGTTLAAGGADARLWDVASGEQLYLLEGPIGEVVDVAFSADGRLLVTGGGSHTIVFRDTASGAAVAVREVGAAENFVYSVAFNADNTLLATCEHDQMLRLWGVPGQ